MSTPTPEQAQAIAEALASGNIIVCRTKCESCLGGCHYDDELTWHPWASPEDIAWAASTGQPDPSGQRCGCYCADGPKS